MKRLAALTAGVTLAIALGVGAQDRSHDKQALIAAAKRGGAALARQDHAAWAKGLHDQMLTVDSFGGVHERDEHVGHFRAGRNRLEALEADQFKVEIHGDVGVVVFRSHPRGKILGKAVRPDMRAMQVYRKEGGQWVCIAHSYTPIVSAAPK
jgi:hypothetical protein